MVFTVLLLHQWIPVSGQVEHTHKSIQTVYHQLMKELRAWTDETYLDAAAASLQYIYIHPLNKTRALSLGKDFCVWGGCLHSCSPFHRLSSADLNVGVEEKCKHHFHKIFLRLSDGNLYSHQTLQQCNG